MMLTYTTDDKKCRSQVIATYFGDDNTKPCGICDNCLSKKNQSITKEEFEKIQQQILTALKPGAVKTKDLLKAMGTVKKEKLLKVLEFLQSENIINVNKDDEVIMTGSK
jgi:ATP-dependent DNA helicase RecQ